VGGAQIPTQALAQLPSSRLSSRPRSGASAVAPRVVANTHYTSTSARLYLDSKLN
jgi:hypothetical protein